MSKCLPAAQVDTSVYRYSGEGCFKIDPDWPKDVELSCGNSLNNGDGFNFNITHRRGNLWNRYTATSTTYLRQIRGFVLVV